MLSTVIDQEVCRGFSNAAFRYDRLTDLHKEIGTKLMARLECVEDFQTLLDVGMGTGWFTNQLKNSFPDAVVVGLDFAPGMVACARQKKGKMIIVQADAARLPFKEGVFDVITSNLAYQWVEDLSRAFKLCRSRLRGRGGLYLTMFGRHTFYELFTALDARVTGKDGLTIRRLADEQQVTEALASAGFRSRKVRAEQIQVRFPDMMHLIKWIKDIGANALPRDIYMGRDLLLRANEYYNQHFKDAAGVYATFEVIWVEARR
ncbi:MAG: methyltransferase domain-containing protein [Candidatus Omnitrophica bacterium]|nr:methyltransferase domain-containing protein [Candidatus Omnitrophota bacterium]